MEPKRPPPQRQPSRFDVCMEEVEVLPRARHQVQRGAACAQLPRHDAVRPLRRRQFWQSRLRGERFLLPLPSRGDGQVPEVQRRYGISAHRQRRLLQHHGLGVIAGERLFEQRGLRCALYRILDWKGNLGGDKIASIAIVRKMSLAVAAPTT